MEEEKILKCSITINKIFFPKNGIVEDGKFTIFSANIDSVEEGYPQINKYETISVKGVSCSLSYAKTYSLIAKENYDSKWGYQYEIIYITEKIDLNSAESQKRYLETILTEAQVELLYKAFKNPFDILNNRDINKLIEVKGIGQKKAEDIMNRFELNKDNAQAYIELSNYGLTKNAIDKIVYTYGSPTTACKKIKANPYILMDEVDGYGWNKADNIALASGIGEYSRERITAYIKYFLNKEALNGNSWVYSDDLWDGLDNGIGNAIDEDKVVEIVHNLEEKKILWLSKDRTRMGLKRYYNLEYSICKELIRLATSDNNFEYKDYEKKLDELQIRQGWNFTEEQLNGIKTILENQVVLVIGSAGTGKSTTVGGMLEVFNGEYTFAQCALSGRASGNLTDITGEEGYTIHRLLGVDLEHKGKFVHNRNNPLSSKVVILDELSMVGEEIFYSLIQSICDGSKLIMLGDIKQLESIGLGNLIKDMIESGVIKTVELTKIHRQAEASGIITESLKASKKEQLVEKDFEGTLIKGELQDMEYDIFSKKGETVKRMISHFKKLLEKGISTDDIQLIVPMKDRGETSAYNINNLIQDIIIKNKEEEHIIIGKQSKTPRTIYVGDRIINHRNNYQIKLANYSEEDSPVTIPIFNGDLGKVTSINKDGTINVKFNNKDEVIIPQDHLNEIWLGYCITTHKMQGSGAKYVICGIDYSHYKLLTREMIYTMLTRAKKYCILCAENKALRYAISNSNVKKKQTFLCDLLRNAISNLEDFKKNIKPVVLKEDKEIDKFRFLEENIIF